MFRFAFPIQVQCCEKKRLLRAAVGARCGRSHISAAHRSGVVKSRASSGACFSRQWDCICSFVKDFGKDASASPKSACYRRVAAMLSNEEKKRTKGQLEFIRNVSPLVCMPLYFFQKSCPQIHILYGKMCEFLLKVMSRFLKKSAHQKHAWQQDARC